MAFNRLLGDGSHSGIEKFAGFAMNTQPSNVSMFHGAADPLARESAELSKAGVIDEILRCLDPHLHENSASEIHPDFRKGMRLALFGSACFWLVAGLLIHSVI